VLVYVVISDINVFSSVEAFVEIVLLNPDGGVPDVKTPVTFTAYQYPLFIVVEPVFIIVLSANTPY
jgi:hypothetical protein